MEQILDQVAQVEAVFLKGERSAARSPNDDEDDDDGGHDWVKVMFVLHWICLVECKTELLKKPRKKLKVPK